MNYTSLTRQILVLFIYIFSTVSYGQLLTFNLTNEAATGCANEMNAGKFAFNTFSWDASTSATAVAENMTSVSGTENLSYVSTTYTLKNYKHINVVNPNGDPTTFGERGDYRIYADGTITISESGIPKLVLTNCITSAKISWPNGLGGPGDDVVGYGWGTIDVANSDPAWIAEFDANGTRQVYVEYSSISNVVQATCGETGRFNFTLNFYPSTYSKDIHSRSVNLQTAPIKGSSNRTMATTVDMSEINLLFNFSSATNGGSGNNKNDLYGEYRTDNPGGNKPAGINAIGSDGYWNIGTTLSSFNTSLTFDLSSYNGINDMSNIRMLRRATEDSDWEIYSSQVVSGNTIVCSDVSAFSQWAVGTLGGDPLPVELKSFTAEKNNNLVLLTWQTATEVNNYGFQVERQKKKGEREWENIGFVDGHGNSNSPNEYSFVDTDKLSGTVSYRLKQLDFDGGFEYLDVVTVELNGNMEYKLAQNNPNPFNPSTQISFTIPETGVVKLNVFNMLGEKVAELVNKNLEAGSHQYNFDANNLTSGIYFYSISVNGFTQVKKMNLIK